MQSLELYSLANFAAVVVSLNPVCMRGRCKSRQIGGARESRLPWRRRRRPPGDTQGDQCTQYLTDLSDGLFDSIVPLRARFAIAFSSPIY